MRILITGVGGPTPRSFAQSLRKYSHYARYELIGTDSNPLALGLYMPELYNKSYVIPKVSEPDYWPVIEKIIHENDIEYAVINPELEVIEWARRAISHKLPVKVLIPEYQLAKNLFDKSIVCQILEPHGLVPRSFAITREELSSRNDLPLQFPFWIRSASGSSGLGSLKITSFDELKNWMNINRNVEKFLASEFLPGRNLGCKMLYYNGSLIRSAIAERVYYIMSKVAPSGITGNTSFGRLVNDHKVFDVSKRAMEILFENTKSPKHGFFTVDLKEDSEGKPYVTEINLRFVAFAQCYAAGGANLPEDLIRLLDQDQTFNTDFKLYQFDPDMIFLRDVDEQPIIMKESQLLRQLRT